MDDKNLETTKELNNLDEIIKNDKPVESPNRFIHNTNLEEDKNQIMELTDEINAVDETIKRIDNLTNEVKDVKEKKSIFKRMKAKWTSFSRKKRRIIIISSIVVFILLVLLVLILVLKKDKNNSTDENKNVVLEADNYRYDNGKLVFLGKDDKELGEYKCKNKDEKLCYVAFLSNQENYDREKNIYEDGTLVEQRSQIIDETYVFVFDNAKKDDKTIKLYDMKKKEELGEYTAVALSSSQVIIAADKSESYGAFRIVEQTVSNILDFNYDDIRFYNDEDHKYFMVNEGGRNYLISDTKKAVTKAVSSTIIDYNEKYVVTKSDDNKYYVFDYKGNQVFESGSDYAKLFKDFVVIVDNNELFLRFYDKKKVSEKTYKVNPKYKRYQKTYVYDKDKKLVEEYIPFLVVLNNTTITITVDEKDNIINLKEAEISKDTNYVNYFDGVLYFYDDLEKENLVAQYKCTNTNNLNSTSKTFDSCFIASDTVKHDNDIENYTSNGLIPILNGRYVFIKDNPAAVSEANMTVVLYDIKNKKVIKKYKTVDTALNTNSDQPTYKDVTNLPIILKNDKDKYGVLKIDASGEMNPLIKFDYTSVEKLGDYFVASSSDGHVLFNRNGEAASQKLPGKIRGYNSRYLKTVENGSYYVYEKEGTSKINNNGFRYIDLYDTYFVAVDSTNKLNVYKYDDANTALINGGVQLYSTSYFKTNTPAYRVSFSGNTALISVYKEDEYTPATTYTLGAQNNTEGNE